MKGIYLAAFRAFHPDYDLVYQDINGKRDIAGDMMDIDLSSYDFIIASPPCNYYSKANYRRDKSSYSLLTRHLLPDILKKLVLLDKPFIVENVRNFPLFKKLGLFDLPCFVYFIGRHTYWTNIMFCNDIEQSCEFINDISQCKREGGTNVYNVIDMFLKTIN